MALSLATRAFAFWATLLALPCFRSSRLPFRPVPSEAVHGTVSLGRPQGALQLGEQWFRFPTSPGWVGEPDLCTQLFSLLVFFFLKLLKLSWSELNVYAVPLGGPDNELWETSADQWGWTRRRTPALSHAVVSHWGRLSFLLLTLPRTQSLGNDCFSGFYNELSPFQ